MGFRDFDYATAVANAPHLIAIGDTVQYLRSDEGFPWAKVVSIETGSSYRLNGPSSAYVVAEDAGLTFKLDVDFEARSANGSGFAMFDRDRLRDVAIKLPAPVRRMFADMLAKEVLPPLAKRTDEIRQALNSQLDSEECVRGLIAFADQSK